MTEREQTTRRAFLERSAVAAVAVTVGANRDDTPHAVQRPFPTGQQDFPLEERTIAQLQAMQRSGEMSAERMTELYLARIAALDRQGPMLRHIIETNPDAISIARDLDAERRNGRVRGPLHGIPIIIKDNIDTADKMHTSAGSLALAESIAPRDAFIAERLRAAGAILLAKANLSEWANFRSTKSSSGWSARGGQGRNPYVLDRSPCGSSSGTGGAIAASYAAAGVGTETDGSIVCPSSASGLVGIKPTLGLLSGEGIVPIAHSQDTAGPMARTVADAALLLGAMTMTSPSLTSRTGGPVLTDYSASLDPNGLRAARIGVMRNRVTGYNTETDRLYANAIDAMRRAGAIIVDPADVPHMGEYDDTEFTVLLYEFKNDLNAYLAGLRPNVQARTLADLIAFNERNRDGQMPYFGQEIFLMAQEKGPLTDQAYIDALAKNQRLSRAEGIDAVMTQHRLDALIAPTGAPSWPIDLLNGDHFTGGSSTPAAVSGYPSITVPAGDVYGLPVGLSFIGRAWSEAALIKLAYAYEQATKHRKPPRFLATAELSGYSRR